MIKNIILDLGGVLIDISMQNTLTEFARLGIDVQGFMDRMKNGHSVKTCPGATMCEGVSAFGPMDEYMVGNISTDEFMSLWMKLSRPGTTREEVERAWNSCLFSIPQRRLDAIAELRAQGYRIYMLSNTNEAHWQHIIQECPTLPSLFDGIFLSQELHLAKPHADIFKEVLRLIDAPADECLFVDDSSKNTEAAAVLGIHTFTANISRLQPDGTFIPPQKEWYQAINLNDKKNKTTTQTNQNDIH